MPGKLKSAEIATLRDPGKYSDGEGLYLRVTKTGTKSWIHRFKGRDLGLGKWPDVSLDEARSKAAAKRGRPRRAPARVARRALAGAGTPTFAELVVEHDRIHGTMRREQTIRNRQSAMRCHILPVLGDMPASEITREDVIRALEPCLENRPNRANLCRTLIRQVMKAAVVRGYCEHNPAGEVLDGLIPTDLGLRRVHHRALPWQEVPGLWEQLPGMNHFGLQVHRRLALQFIILTAARLNEAKGAQWAEIDMRARVWSIPGERMKTRHPHRVPITDAMAAVIAEAGAQRKQGSRLVFPGFRGGADVEMGAPSIRGILVDLGWFDRCTIHGFRTSFRTWAAEHGYYREHAEAALAHVVGGVEGAYQRSDYLEQRRPMMEAWGRFVTGGNSENAALDLAA